MSKKKSVVPLINDEMERSMSDPERSKSLVTGASSGIGRAIAVALAARGDYVVLTARSTDGLAETLQLVKSSGGDGTILEADLTDPGSIKNLTNAINSKVGALDVIVNVAGVWHDGSRAFSGPRLYELGEDEVRTVMEVGAVAPIVLTSHLLPAMIERRSGHVVNISGTFSEGGAGWLHYYVSKKAIENFTVALADELRPFEIQVNCVSPADVATEPYVKFFPEYAAAALKPEEVGEFVVYLLGQQFRNVTGQVIVLRNKSDHE